MTGEEKRAIADRLLAAFDRGEKPADALARELDGVMCSLFPWPELGAGLAVRLVVVDPASTLDSFWVHIVDRINGRVVLEPVVPIDVDKLPSGETTSDRDFDSAQESDN